MQAVVADAREKGGVGIEQPVEPVDQHAGRQQIEQRAVALQLAARRRLGFFQPLRARRRFARRLGRRCSRFNGLIFHICHERLARLAILEPRRQLPGELVEGLILDRREHGRSGVAERAKRHRRFGAFPRAYPDRLVLKFHLGSTPAPRRAASQLLPRADVRRERAAIGPEDCQRVGTRSRRRLDRRGAARRDARGCRGRGTRQNRDSRRNCVGRRRQAVPTARPAGGRRRRPASRR